MVRGGGWQRAAREQLRRMGASSSKTLQQPSLLAHSVVVPRAPFLQQPLAVVGFATQSSSSSGKKKLPSFAIAEAFEGLDDESDDDDDDDNSDRKRRGDDNSSSPESEESKRVSREFMLAMDKKKSWMQTLAQERKYKHIVKTVFDCYAPLYAQQPSLMATSSLLTKLFDESTVETKYQPRLFNDTLTKITEQEALALLVIARQGPLATAVFEHRRSLANQIAALSSQVIVQGENVMSDTIVDLSGHFRSFYSWGMGAYSLVNDHDKLFALYKEAADADVYPTANMNASYLKSLVTVRRPSDQVLAFYNDVVKNNRPTNIFFYRQMLFFASVNHDAGLLLQLLDDMKMNGFKLRADDYLNAIKTFDDQYYLKPRKSVSSSSKRESDEIKLTTPLDTYASCTTRIDDQEEHPELYQELDDAAHSVVALFEEMVDEERLTPKSELFYPRVISAAVYLNEPAKALAFLALHEKHCPGLPLHHAGVRMAVNAFLLLDQPQEAWDFVRKSYDRIDQREFPHVANIIEYLCVKNDAAQLVKLLNDAKDMHILSFFSNNTTKILLPALIRSVESVSDEQLWDTVCLFEKVFSVRSKPYAYSQFLNECVFRKRFAAAKRALKQRDERRVGSLKTRLGLRVMTTFSDAGDVAFVPEVFKAVDLKAAKQDELVEICCFVIRANQQLERFDESQRVFAKHLQPLLASGKLSELPEDILAAGGGQ